MKERIENYWRVFQNINDWIKFSDTKAGIIITVYGLILTIIYTNAQSVFVVITSSTIMTLFTLIAVILSILSILYSFLCINPSLKNNNPTSLIYFRHIATKNKKYEDYLKQTEMIFEDKNKLSEQLSEQIFENSKIATKKFNNVTYSIRFFFSSMIFLIIILFIYYIN